jgi:hypothetical protein
MGDSAAAFSAKQDPAADATHELQEMACWGTGRLRAIVFAMSALLLKADIRSLRDQVR